MSKTLFLIDGHAQVFRAFYAVEGLRTPDGHPSGAIFGFTRMLNDLIRRQKPDHLIAVFDARGKTFRHEMFAAYKGTRKPTPPELIEQVPKIQDVVAAYRIPVIQQVGYEADDLIGALAVQGAAAGLNVVIVTGDKDCGQLLNDKVRMYDAKKNTFTTADDFVAKKNIRPDQLVDLMGLWGDSSDNIPGVAGIGEKIGVQLIQQYGSLENLLDHAGEIKGKRGETLRASKEVALLSKQLATIDINAPVTYDQAASVCQEPDTARLIELFETFGFRSMLREMQADAPAPAERTVNYQLINTPELFADFYRNLSAVSHFAFDTETTGLNPLRADIVGLSFCWATGTGDYLPLQAPDGARTLGDTELAQVAAILEDPKISKCGQNLKYDALVLHRAGITLRGITFDSLIASNILSGHVQNHGLDALAQRHLGLTKVPTKDLIGSGKKQICMNEVPLKDITDYACEDVDACWQLEPLLQKELTARKSVDLLTQLELPLAEVLTKMQATGIRVDADILHKQSAEIGTILHALTGEIHEVAGHEFNIASPKQLAVILFEEMNLPVIRKTKTGASTDEAVLHELKAQGHELPGLILEYRMYAKLKSTYLDALPTMINPDTGRIHTTFSQTIAATGRLSSRDPNLQNIPIRTENGRAVRAAFVPEDGWTLLAADYSQVELRVLAHYSDDEMLKAAFAEGRDIHAVVAAEVNGIPEEEVTSAQRSSAKAINFGIIYGQGAHGLSQSTGMSIGEARLFIDTYFEQFPRIRTFMDDTLDEAHKTGYVETILGRRREIPDLASSNKMLRARADREAVNTVIQGSAADLIKRAMIHLDTRMQAEKLRSRMLLQIHDELVFESPADELDTLQKIVREEMESALDLAVPLTVDMGTGTNWLEVK